MLRCSRRVSGFKKFTLGYRELVALLLEGICGIWFHQSLIGVQVRSCLLPRCVYGHVYRDAWSRNELLCCCIKCGPRNFLLARAQYACMKRPLWFVGFDT